MARPIHHAITKRAKRLGVTIVEADGQFFAARVHSLTKEGYDAAKALLDAVETEQVTWVKTASGYCGVMVASYHDRYEHNAHGPGSCDGLDCALRDAYTTPQGVDVDGLFALGSQLGLWNASWEGLNPGMKRMNLSNRIRAWLRNNADAGLTIDGKTGRFGVAYRPAGKAARRLAKAA